MGVGWPCWQHEVEPQPGIRHLHATACHSTGKRAALTGVSEQASCGFIRHGCIEPSQIQKHSPPGERIAVGSPGAGAERPGLRVCNSVQTLRAVQTLRVVGAEEHAPRGPFGAGQVKEQAESQTSGQDREQAGHVCEVTFAADLLSSDTRGRGLVDR